MGYFCNFCILDCLPKLGIQHPKHIKDKKYVHKGKLLPILSLEWNNEKFVFWQYSCGMSFWVCFSVHDSNLLSLIC